MSTRFVAFTVGSTRYCLPIDEVRQIVRHENVTSVPQAPRFVEGVINLRGEVVPVIGMRERLGVVGEEGPRKSRLIIVTQAGRAYGLHVDDVREIVDVPDADISAAGLDVLGPGSPHVRGVARVQDQLLVVLDLTALLAGSRPAGPAPAAARAAREPADG